MTPIRPDQRGRYPANWPAISELVRFRRAGGRCECTGECGHNHRAELDENPAADLVGDTDAELAEVFGDLTRCLAEHGRPHPVTDSRVVLTTAHLDHQPENCDMANLRAMCQRCHLAYDREHHAETRAASKIQGESPMTDLDPELRAGVEEQLSGPQELAENEWWAHKLRTVLAAHDRLLGEVGQLRAGADDSPILNGSMPTPGQWIARFLAAGAHGRRDIAAAALEAGQRAARCFEMNHEGALKQMMAWQRRLAAVTAAVTDLPDGQLHVEWTGREEGDWTLMVPALLDGLVEKHNALVRELAEVARERTAAWQAYADVMGEHQAAEARQKARAAAGATS